MLCLLTGWLAGWAVLPVAAGAMPHGAAGAAGVLVAASLALALTVLIRPGVLPRAAVTLPATGQVGLDGRPCRAPRAFDPDTAGRPRPRAPGRAAPPSG